MTRLARMLITLDRQRRASRRLDRWIKGELRKPEMWDKPSVLIVPTRVAVS